MSGNRYKAIFFDLDGTLIDSSRDIATAVNATLSGLDMKTLPEETIFGYIGNGIEKLMQRALGTSIHGDASYSFPEDYVWEKVRILRENYRKYMLETTRPFRGIPELLDAVFRRNVHLGIISNKPHFYTVEIVNALQLGQYFRQIYGGDSFPERKPHPLPLTEAIRKAGVNGGDTLMIGDSMVDIIMGRSAGTDTCAVTWGLKTRRELQCETPTWMVDTPKELEKILE